MGFIQTVLVLSSIVLLLPGLPRACQAAGANSAYLALSTDTDIRDAHAVLQASIDGDQSALITSDGSFRPHKPSTAKIFITVDGKRVSNESNIDWRTSKLPAAHSFKAAAVLHLSPGKHMVALMAEGSDNFVVSAGSNLCIMTNPAARFSTDTLKQNSDLVSLSQPSQAGKGKPITYKPLLEVNMPKPAGPQIAIATGDVFTSEARSNWGDALWGLSADGREVSNNNASYANNDMCSNAEFRAPIFLQGFLNSPCEKITLGATALPWQKTDGTFNTVRFQSGVGSKLLVLSGGMQVAGHVSLINSPKENSEHNTTAYRCVGSSQNWPGCGCTGDDTMVAEAHVHIPENHNGVVYFSSMTRVQGASADKGGLVRVWLTIDGHHCGSTGIQLLREHDCVSERTVTASYLAAGREKLTPGDHVVQMHARATGEFIHLCVTKDMPLMWFD